MPRLPDALDLEGDTGGGPYGSGTFASRSVVTGGGAIVRAAAKLRGKMARLAGHQLEAAPEDIALEDGHAFVRGMPTSRVTVREIAENAYSMSSKGLPPGEDYGLEATDYYDPPLVTMPTPPTWPRSRWTPAPAASRSSGTSSSTTAGGSSIR